MKKKLLIIAVMLFGLFTFVGCSENANVTEWGGTKEIVLPENMKFINYNIQNEAMIWCTYRPMRKDESPETYIIQQDKSGLQFTGDGRFIVYEVKDGVKSEKVE